MVSTCVGGGGYGASFLAAPVCNLGICLHHETSVSLTHRLGPPNRSWLKITHSSDDDQLTLPPLLPVPGDRGVFCGQSANLDRDVNAESDDQQLAVVEVEGCTFAKVTLEGVLLAFRERPGS